MQGLPAFLGRGLTEAWGLPQPVEAKGRTLCLASVTLKVRDPKAKGERPGLSLFFAWKLLTLEQAELDPDDRLHSDPSVTC